MKKLKQYWPYVYAAFIAIYEAQAELLDNEFIPVWIKGTLGVIATIGLILKRIPKNEKPG